MTNSQLDTTNDVVAIKSPSVGNKGIYTEHMVISPSRVTEPAVACSSVCYLCGKDDCTNIEALPRGPQTIIMNIVIC